MTPEQQRIAIAQACGWKLMYCRFHNATTWHSPQGICAEGNTEIVLPDYLNDLDAMHEAEKVLTKHEPGVFLGHLAEVHGQIPSVWASVHATAAQRAEAFCKTLNLETKTNQ